MSLFPHLMCKAPGENYQVNLRPLHNPWVDGDDHALHFHELLSPNLLIQMFSLMVTFQYVLMELIKKELKSWSETLRIDNVPKAPTG